MFSENHSQHLQSPSVHRIGTTFLNRSSSGNRASRNLALTIGFHIKIVSDCPFLHTTHTDRDIYIYILYYILLYFIISYHIILYLLYYIILYYILLYHIISYYIYCIILYFIFYFILYYIILYYIIFYYIISYHIILYLLYYIIFYMLFYYIILYIYYMYILYIYIYSATPCTVYNYLRIAQQSGRIRSAVHGNGNGVYSTYTLRVG